MVQFATARFFAEQHAMSLSADEPAAPSFEDGLDTNSETSSVSSGSNNRAGGVFIQSKPGGSRAGSSTGGGRSTAQATINKLTHEIAVLRESFEQLNGLDIVTLSSKLRGAKDDIAALKQRNNELKSRVQILEGKLFQALNSHGNGASSTYNHNSTDSESVLSSSSSARVSNRSAVVKRLHGGIRLEDSERSADATDSSNADLRSDYLEKTNASLVQKLRELQALLGNQSSNTANAAAAAAAATKPAPKQRRKSGSGGGAGVLEEIKHRILESALSRNKEINNDDVEQLSLGIEALVASLREGDAKTIRELAVEVRALSKWVPKEEVEEEEDLDSNTKNLVNIQSTDRRETNSSETVSTEAQQRAPPRMRRHRPEAHAYDTSHIYCSFAAGVLLMLLSIALSRAIGGGAVFFALRDRNATSEGL